jgi:hypothetical protein
MKISILISFSILPFLAFSQTPIKKTYYPGGRKIEYEDLRKPTVIKISPFHLFDNQFNVSMEFFNKTTYRSSIAIAANCIYADNAKVADQGFSLDIQKRIYPRGFSSDTVAYYRNGAGGFYVGFGIQLGYSEYRDKNISEWFFRIDTIKDGTNKIPVRSDYEIKRNVMTRNIWALPYVELGYQFIIWEALYIDCFLGGGVKINNVTKSSPDKSLNLDTYYNDPGILKRYYKGIIPRIGLSLGVGF